MNEIEKILNTNEKIIWEGTPDFRINMLMGYIFVGGFSLFLFIFAIISLLNDSVFTASIFFLSTIILLIFIPLSEITLKRIRYFFTDKRIIIQSGLIGLDYSIVDYDKIQSMNVNVGLLDKLFNGNTGSIYIYSGLMGASQYGSYSVPHMLFTIQDPYKVFEILKKLSHDIKSDIEYPNNLRPENNSGYNTEYNPK